MSVQVHVRIYHDLIRTIYSVDPTGIILEKNLFIDGMGCPGQPSMSLEWILEASRWDFPVVDFRNWEGPSLG